MIPGNPSSVLGITPNSIKRTLNNSESPSIAHKIDTKHTGQKIVFSKTDFFNLFI